MIFSDTASAVMQKYLLISHRCCYHCGLLLMVHNGSTKFQLEVSKKKKKDTVLPQPQFMSPLNWIHAPSTGRPVDPDDTPEVSALCPWLTEVSWLSPCF